MPSLPTIARIVALVGLGFLATPSPVARGATNYLVTFEGAGETKTAYAAGTVTLGGLSWNFAEALVGDLANDRKNGARSARLRNTTGVMTMLADVTGGAGVVSFQYGKYGTDANSALALDYSTDAGANWANAGTVTVSSTSLTAYSTNLAQAGAIRLRIRKTAGASDSTRANVDDILVLAPESGNPVTNVQFTAASAAVGEAGVVWTATVYKSLASGDVSGQVGLGGTASPGGGADYTIDTTNFALNGAVTSAAFVISINDDAAVESPETIVLTLANVTGGTVGSPSALTLTINDNDGGGTPPVLAAIGSKSTRTNTLLSFTVSATPTEADVVTLSASNLPAGASFFPTNEYGSFHWPAPAPAGVYTVGFYAVDNDGADSELVTITVTNTPAAGGGVPNVWINELHYDNGGASGDTNEGVEVAGAAGIDLSQLELAYYDGEPSGSRLVYGNVALAGSIPNESNGFGAVWFGLAYSSSGLMQNGPDGVALVRNGTQVLEFISYEGIFTAGNGPAAGMMSTDIGVSESNSTPEGHALQRCGVGTNGASFSWTSPSPHSRGLLNACQTIPSGGGGGGDVDGDGMPDDWETLYFGGVTNEAAGDFDGDGFQNGQEFIAFTSPADSNSYFRAVGATNAAGVQVVFPSVTGRLYRLWGSPLLPAQAWTSVVAGPVAGTGGNLSLGVVGSETGGAVRLSVEMP